MNLNNFQNYISSTILNRGKEYYDEGAVLILEETEDGEWYAEVEGSEVYAVEVELSHNNEIEGYSCNCPHDADVCKHIVAVFYELKDRVKTVLQLRPQKKDPALPFMQLLEKVTITELKKFVERYANSNNDFKTQFELHFAHKDEQVDVEKKYLDMVKKLVRASMSYDFIDYYSANDLSNKIGAVIAKAREALDTNNFKDASIIARVVLKQLMDSVIPNVDDSYGDIGDTVSNTTSLLREIAESELCPRVRKEEIHDFLAKELTNDDYFDYGDSGYECFEMYRYLSVLLNRSEAFLTFANQFPKVTNEGEGSNFQSEYYIKQTILFLKEIGNESEAEKLIRQNMDIVAIRQEIVEQEIERKNYMEAKDLIYQGIILAEKRSHPGTVTQWKKALLRIACLEGDIVLQRHFNLLFTFNLGFEVEYYQNWKNTFQEAEWPTEFDNLIQKIVEEVELEAEKHLNHHWWSKNNTLLNRLAPIYVQEKQWDKLYELVEAYPSLEALLNYMKYLAADYQPQLTDLLSPAIILAGDRADSRSGYARVASYLKDVMKQMPASRSKMLETAQILRQKYPRRPAMLDELKSVR